MKHELSKGIARTGIRSAPVLVCTVCAAAAVAATVPSDQVDSRARGHVALSLVPSPGTRRVMAGRTARYRIVIRRRPPRAKVVVRVLSAAGLLSRPGLRAGNRVILHIRARAVVLAIKTARRDRPGRYRVRLKVVAGRYRDYLTLGLTIARAQTASFEIAGSFGPLWPGTSQVLDLALTNPNSQTISVDSLQVSIEKVTAPRASGALPCSAADFAVTPFAGSYPLTVPARATVHLSDLGVTAARAPRLEMVDRPVNQDGCQGATVALAYSGTATTP